MLDDIRAGENPVLSLALAENFLKSSPKCLLACVSCGTRGKIQNRGFFHAVGPFSSRLVDFNF